MHAPRKGLVVFMLLAFMLSGCYRAVVMTTPFAPTGHTETAWVHTVIGGLFPLNKIDATRICHNEHVSTVTTRLSFLSLVAGAITVGLYTPVKVSVTCTPAAAPTPAAAIP